MRVKLTAEDFERIEKKKLANAIRRLNAEKPLTSAEEKLLARAKAAVQQGRDPAAAAAGPEPSYAQTWGELADLLGVSRRAIDAWRKDPRYTDWPRDRDDGRKDVAAWRDYMIRHGLKRADQHVASGPGDDDAEADVLNPPAIGGCEADWKKANLALDHRRKENEIGEQEGRLLVGAELEIPLGATLVAIQNKLTQMPATAARFVAGLRDVQEVEEVLRKETDLVLADLHAADYLDTAPLDLARQLPFDAESERLLQLVTFEGQDRAALVALVAHLASEVLRRLGRAAIARAQAPGEILDAATGQVTDEAAEAQASARADAPPSSARAESVPSPAPKASQKTAAAKTAGKARRKRPAPQPAKPPAEDDARARTPAPPRRKKRRR